MKDLNYQLKALCRRNRDGSFSTQAVRERVLSRIANQLYALGYRGMSAKSLKPKHVEALVAHWREEGLSVGSQKNRMAAVRWWAEKVNRRNVVARDNGHYGILEPGSVAGVSKSRQLSSDALSQIADGHVRMSLELQRAFGLRREEAIKFMPSFADRGDAVVLKASWAKGGRSRVVPVLTASQRDVLDRAHALVGSHSLIPRDKNYRSQLRTYEGQTVRAGLSKMHGLRHAYAQSRYETLTGWAAPIAGGPVKAELSSAGRRIDRQAREIVSRELGHERIEITALYLGR